MRKAAYSLPSDDPKKDIRRPPPPKGWKTLPQRGVSIFKFVVDDSAFVDNPKEGRGTSSTINHVDDHPFVSTTELPKWKKVVLKILDIKV